MKVMFRCDECGYEESPSVIVADRDCKVDIEQLVTRPCPKCAEKLSYGPLTEEMVAGALQVANDATAEWSKHGVVWDDFVKEARFVLRLVNRCAAPPRLADAPAHWLYGSTHAVRARLLHLAGQS